MSEPVSADGLLGVFAHKDALLEALRRARSTDIEIRDVFTPVPYHEVEDLLASRKSPLRFITFKGAVLGLVGGIALAILTSLTWNLIVGGKPVTSLVPFLVVGFEFTILFGALATLAGLLLLAGLPYRRFPGPAFRPEFSRDRFGVWLVPAASKAAAAREILEEAGAVEIQQVGNSPEEGEGT